MTARKRRRLRLSKRTLRGPENATVSRLDPTDDLVRDPDLPWDFISGPINPTPPTTPARFQRPGSAA